MTHPAIATVRLLPRRVGLQCSSADSSRRGLTWTGAPCDGFAVAYVVADDSAAHDPTAPRVLVAGSHVRHGAARPSGGRDDDMTHDYDDPPLIEGGQGRSAESVRDSATWCLYVFCAAVVTLAVLLLTGGAE